MYVRLVGNYGIKGEPFLTVIWTQLALLSQMNCIQDDGPIIFTDWKCLSNEPEHVAKLPALSLALQVTNLLPLVIVI